MKPVTLKSIEIGYGDDKVIIHPRMASVAEVDEVQRSLNDVADTDTEKYQKEFCICRDAIESFSASPPERLEKVKGEFKRFPLDGGLAARFAERTVENERIIREAYQLILVQCRPESRFL